MGYGTNGLTFNTLRQANLRRLPEFKNAQGEICHTHPTGGDWSFNDWLTAVAGELGELANLLKKVRRGDFTVEELQPQIRDEIADVNIYLDILALQFDIDLGSAIKDKFNVVSDRVGSRVYIGGDGDWHLHPEPEGKDK